MASEPLCVGFSEINKYAIQIYKKHFPTHKNYGNATEINTDELPDFDLLVGGFPCQAFSIAGKRGGFDDTRGTLFFEIARIVKAKKPKTLLLENVKGLLSHNKGETFRVILQTLDELGYHTGWMVLNSKFFGVPQNRERIFIIGSLRGSGRPEILPFRESSENTLGERKISPCLDASYYKGTSPSHAKQGRPRPYVVDRFIENPLKGKTKYGWHFEQNVYSKNSICRSLKSAEGSGNKPKIVAMLNQIAKKRVHKTPLEINEFLRNHKSTRTISEISNLLELPKTQVEHYFRTDSSRSIPSPKEWFKLKNILEFNDKYDKVVTEFYEKEIEFEQSRRVYDSEAISPTLNTQKESTIVAMRGRNPKNPSDRTTGSPTQQRLELNSQGISNTLSSVTKDNLVMGIANSLTADAYLTSGRRKRVNGKPVLTSMFERRIRRLTPLECERLQSFPDGFTKEGIDENGKIVQISNTQRYKCLGNAVTVNVIEAIMKQLIKRFY